MKNTFKDMAPEQLEDMLSQFLISSWSYSKVTSFARHEKVFEMNYIYGVYSKSSATTIAGQAYHKALEYYFSQMKDGVKIDLVELELSAFAHIDEVPANQWKIQKTTPTIDECRLKANSTVSSLLKNFVSEVAIYENDIAEILEVEAYGDEWVCINGVEIPLPLHFKIDLVVKTKAGKIAIVDHKSKNAYTSEDELALGIGVQAITYIKGYEEKSGLSVDEVWFVENKYSKNKGGEPQLSKFTLTVDADTRALYEALLYEPLQRMVKAVMDPDYVYLINDSDNYVDKAELYAFWTRTQLAEISVEDFNVDPGKKELVSKRLKKIRDASVTTVSPMVIKTFRENASKFIQYDLSNKNMTRSEKIEHTLRSFSTPVEVAYTFEGYSSNTYLLRVQAGVKISSIHNKRLDLANALDVENVRISKDLVVHEGKSYLAVDVSKRRETDLLYDAAHLSGLRIPLGKDNFQNLVVWDLENHSTPHALVCGATGSGKSVLIKTTIEYAKEAGIDDIIIFDPKFEFTGYASDNIIVVNDIIEIEEYMDKLVGHMNEMVRHGRRKMTLVIFDEFADAVAQSRKGKDLDIMEMVQTGNYADKKVGMFTVPGAPKMSLKKTGELKSLEENLRILLQKGRSTGFRVMAATQRASVKVITGDAKVNFPVQICFRVPKESDSRVVLDEAGAEALAGYGDGLIKSPEYKETVRFQAFYKPASVMA